MRAASVAAGCLALLACSAHTDAAVVAPLPTVTVTATETAVTRSVDGILEPVEQSVLAAQTMGRILAMTHDVNDPVHRGEVLVHIDDAEAQARMKRADAELARADANAADARTQFGRVQQLYADGVVSKTELDRSRTDDAMAAASVQAATAAQREAREQLSNSTIRAPLDGIVLRRHAEAGEMASPGKPLLTVAVPSRLRILASVPQTWVAALQEGGKARVVLTDGRAFDADAVEIFPAADAATHSYSVRAALPRNTPRVSAGMLAKLEFPAGSERQLSVPAAAIVRRSEITAVYVLEPDGRVSFRQILTGEAGSDGHVVVLSGLHEGDRVITDPAAAGNAVAGGKGGR